MASEFVKAVNVASDGDRIIVYLRVDEEWHRYAVRRRDAETLSDMLYLITKERQ